VIRLTMCTIRLDDLYSFVPAAEKPMEFRRAELIAEFAERLHNARDFFRR